MFPLEVFPYASLSSSVTTTVWIGVLVIAVFNLRLGWVLSGLVVPGYLVPLVIVKPWSATIIVIESIVVYACVYFISEFLSGLSRWSSLFGRDRFFALIIVSVLVRLGFDVMLIPSIGDWLNSSFGIQFDYRNQLQVFGLIIVSLMANQYWKTGLARGLFVLGVTLGITWLIVRFGLMELTNFSIGSLRFMYEDIASSLLASPKAYIILLTTAFICSRLNLRYGWDFNGILLPSLLALQWFAPYKILASFVEAYVILIIARALLKLEYFKQINMEGARLMLLFFNISFAYKMALGFVMPTIAPDFKVSDSYGFGYLLATLLALKMHEKDIVGRVSRVTLQASGIAIVFASLIGFSLTFVGPLLVKPTTLTPLQQVSEPAPVEGTLEALMLAERVNMYSAYLAATPTRPTAVEYNDIHNAFRALKRYLSAGVHDDYQLAVNLLSGAGFKIRLVEQRHMIVSDAVPRRGWGVYLVNLAPNAKLHYQLPYALGDDNAIGSAIALFSRLGGSTLAISGIPPVDGSRYDYDPLLDNLNVYHLFHSVFARHDVVQLLPAEASGPTSRMVVNSQLPNDLNLSDLKSLIGGFELAWRDDRRINMQRDTAQGAFVSLTLSPDADAQLSGFDADEAMGVVSTQSLQALIHGHYEAALEISTGAANPQHAPSLSELLYLDREIVTPLIHIVEAEYSGGALSVSGRRRLQAVARAASAIGYQLTWHRDRTSMSPTHLILAENPAFAARGWGAAIFRLRHGNDYVVSVPRPHSHVGSVEVGMRLFERLEARAMVQVVNEALLPAVDRPAKEATALSELVNQVVMRELADRPVMTIMPRAMAFETQAGRQDKDALLAFDNGEHRWTQLDDPLVAGLIQELKREGLDVGLVDGQPENVGYEASWLPESRYTSAATDKRVAILWLAPRVRFGLAVSSGDQQHAAFAALGIPIKTGEFDAIVDQHAANDAGSVPKALTETVESYLVNRDIVTLQAIRERWPQYLLEYFFDTDTRQGFLLLSTRAEDASPSSLVAVANVSRASQSVRRHPRQLVDRESLRAFAASDDDLLLSGESL